jgi:hypothetical protein
MRIQDTPILKTLFSKIVFNRNAKGNLTVPDAQLIIRDIASLYDRTTAAENNLNELNEEVSDDDYFLYASEYFGVDDEGNLTPVAQIHTILKESIFKINENGSLSPSGSLNDSRSFFTLDSNFDIIPKL